MNKIIDITLYQLLIAYVFVIITLIIIRIRGIKREKHIFISCIRMTIQLVIAGYVLLYVFDNPSWYLTALIVAIMLAFSVFNIFRRATFKLDKDMKVLIVISMIIGTFITTGIFIVVVIGVIPWYNPQYFIPITGMIVGNSMTGITLGLNKLYSEMNDKRSIIENSLMLGATPKQATKKFVNNAFDTALLPTINSMIGMGIVSLPGMMTGQILSGTLPTVAIKYQIGIILAIMASVSLTVIIFLSLGYKTFFNKQQQLI